MVGRLVLLGLTACYSPRYVEGLECSPQGDCPPNQQCSLADYRCYAAIADASNGPIIDARRVDGALADAINCVPSGTEICDGEDNDCNGSSDDGVLPQVGILCVNQAGACAGGTTYCGSGVIRCNQGSSEICNGVDDDCNGVVDDSCPPPTCAAVPAGLVSWWRGEGNLSDHGTGNTLTSVGTVTFPTGKVGQSIHFANQAYARGPATKLPTGASNRTIEGWARFTTNYAGLAEGLLVGYGTWGQLNGVSSVLLIDPNALAFSTWGPGISDPSSSSLNTWFHFAVTVASTVATLYVNGSPVATATLGSMSTSSGSMVYMGGFPNPPDNRPEWLNGDVDEVSIYSRALSMSEIQAIVAAGSAGKCIDCELYPQSDCVSGNKCTLGQNSFPANVCVGDGVVSPGGVCSGFGSDDNCTAGSLCLFETCHAYCAGEGSATCSGSQVCVSFGDFTSCMTTCNPLSPSCPMSSGYSQNCYFNRVAGVGECVPGSNTIPVGGTCTALNDCVAGSGCTDEAICRKYCDYGATPNMQGSCASGQTCQLISNNVGECK
jgi:hypothetical protein